MPDGTLKTRKELAGIAKVSETTIASLAADIHETEKRLAPIKKKRAELETSLTEQRNQNEKVITENASLTRENEQLEKQIADAPPIIDILQAELHSVKNNAYEILTELVLVPSERQKREQLIKSAESLFTLRMWVGVWKAERDGFRLKTSVPHQSDASASDVPAPSGDVSTYTPLSPNAY